MTLVADENVDGPIVEGLRSAGHHVLWIAELAPGIVDEIVLDHSRQASAVLVTADKDFGELVFRQRRVYSGVLLVRLPGLSPQSRAALVVRVIEEHGDALTDAFAVLAPGNFRLRRRVV